MQEKTNLNINNQNQMEEINMFKLFKKNKSDNQMIFELSEAIRNGFNLNYSKDFDLEIIGQSLHLKFYQCGEELEYLHLHVGISRLFGEANYVLCGHAFYEKDNVVVEARTTCSDNPKEIVTAILKESSHHYMGRLGLPVLMERRVPRSY
jgi:hypothetical protein